MVVDEYSCTSVPSIYAVGDVTDRIQLTPVALMEGMAVAKTLFLGQPTKPDYWAVPSAVFSYPEMATVVGGWGAPPGGLATKWWCLWLAWHGCAVLERPLAVA